MTIDASASIATPASGIAGRYTPAIPSFDEMLDADGSLRPHWRPWVSMMDDLGHSEVVSRWDYARRLIRENGITHNVYGDPNGTSRPWNLDLIPLLIPASQWQIVSDAMIQRARLLNALLADLYGPAQVVQSGLLPPELVYANPWFLRPAHGLKMPADRWISMYAADLIRGPGGQFQVIADRTQAPSGTGYCLENRIVLSRAMPSVFRECNVQRLAPFFIALRQMLASMAPSNRDNPRVVLLTPGPYNETYFEHAYLARYLGYTLVQGDDLTVRDSRVFLKTLSGLHRVDVIIRRVDDDYCDPLELQTHSFLGVSGLLQAVREGAVAVANAIGTGLAQAPAFLPYLPALCRHYLSEDLKLPSVSTWWCGDASSLQYVLQNLSSLVIKPAFPAMGSAKMGSFTKMGSDPIFGAELLLEQLQELRDKILSCPNEFVAQQHIESFAAPVFVNDHLQSRRFVVRAYLTASGDSYATMPGGLTRVTGSADSFVVSLQRGGGSKDTWILADGPVSEVTLLPSTASPVELSRGGSDLPSRVADDLFWLGRYMQRAEATVRLARCIFNRLADPNALDQPHTTNLLIHELLGRPMPLGPDAARLLATQLFSVADPSALQSAIERIQRLAGTLRDRISTDAWHILREIERDLPELGAHGDDDYLSAVLELLNRLIAGCLAFSGMAADSMTRGQAWQFLDMGMRLERGLATGRLIRAALVQQSPDELAVLDALLEYSDSALTYRRRYLTRLEVPAVVDLLVADETNPRAVAYQVAAIERLLSGLPRESTYPNRHGDHQLAIKLRAALRLADLQDACRVVDGRREKLDALAADIVDTLGSISELVSQTYFSHATASDRLHPAEQERPTS